MSTDQPDLPERFDLRSADPLAERIDVLRATFPEAFREGKVDVDALARSLGEWVDPGPERFGLTWPGKADCMRVIQEPSLGALVPMPKESVDWDTTQNVIIEGENLEVLKLLQKAYYGKVKMIYIDPPYNTGKEFIYPDNFREGLADYLKYSGQVDDAGFRTSANTETGGRYHSKWLSMMYPRLFLARNLLRDDGFLVVSIDDVELDNLRLILDEIFGSENIIATLVWDRNRKNDAKLFSVGHEYMVIAARNKSYFSDNGIMLRAPKPGVEQVRERFEELRSTHGDNFEEIRAGLRDLYNEWTEDDDPRVPLKRYNKVDNRGPFRDDADISWPGAGGPRYEVLHPTTGLPCKIPKSGWRFTEDRMSEAIASGRVVFGPDESTIPSQRSEMFHLDTQAMRSVNFSYAQTATQKFDKIFDGARVFDNPKHYGDLAKIIEYLTDSGDLILDFFAGSGSLAHGVLESNRAGAQRRYLLVQLPQPVDTSKPAGQSALDLGMRTVSDVTVERMRRVVREFAAESAAQPPLISEPMDLGFRVYRLSASNFSTWQPSIHSVDELTEQVALSITNTSLSSNTAEIASELSTKAGFPLTTDISTMDLPGDLVAYSVGGGALLLFLDANLSTIALEQMIAAGPSMIIATDGAFADDEVKVNALQTVRAHNRREETDLTLRIV
ncbi:site-specific DNA-methyltransferase [Pseudonocardia sp.]|uniref:site-specific DNA-methyltransferase n=1 Tax=Pseudonocardia sp. TaxID=60912 RepID=UPI00260816AC|nr:site-specific DNA-methyltransferase [Pseudonocardia sp.]